MNFLRKLPIKAQLLIIAFSIITIMVFIIFTSYIKTANVIQQKNSEYFTQMITQFNRTIASNCDVVNRLVQNISYSKVVQSYLNETDPVEKFQKYTQLQDYILNLSDMKDGIIDIALFSENGTSFNVNGEIENIYEFKREIPKKQLFYYTGSKKITINNKTRDCFIVGARIYSTLNFENIDNELGTLLILIDVNSLVGYKKELNLRSETEFYMLDRDNKVFFSNDTNMAIQGKDLPIDINNTKSMVKLNGLKYIVQIGDIPDIGGKIVFMVPQSELLSGLDVIREQQFSIFFIALLLLAVPFFFVINNIVQPLKRFIYFMNEIRCGKIKNLKNRIYLKGYAEINIMAGDFNNMLDEIDDLTHRLIETNTRLYEAELAKTQSELEYLKSQINPHFLYNTLESIKGIAVDEGSGNIFNMTKSLGQIFRYSIKGTDIVILNDELNMIKSYLYIQKIRFENRLNIDYEFDSNILQCKIPKMILQPVVENAIYHGIEPKVGQGHLSIGGYLSSEKLIVFIKDDGVGIDKENLELIRKNLEVKNNMKFYSENTVSSSNIGLINVNNRIRLTYGNEFGIKVESQNGNGTSVILNLPVQE